MSFSTIKKIIIGIVVVAVVALLYFALKGDGTSKNGSLLRVSPESQADILLGRELLTVLAELKSVNLDSGFFASEAFTKLRNFGVEIAKQEVGRNNPFAPVGSLGTPRATTTPVSQ